MDKEYREISEEDKKLLTAGLSRELKREKGRLLGVLVCGVVLAVVIIALMVVILAGTIDEETTGGSVLGFTLGFVTTYFLISFIGRLRKAKKEIEEEHGGKDKEQHN